jgi:hypothetical protein
MKIGYVFDFREDFLVLAEHHQVHPARIPALWFRPLFAICSPLLIGYIIDTKMVVVFWFLVLKAKMG